MMKKRLVSIILSVLFALNFIVPISADTEPVLSLTNPFVTIPDSNVNMAYTLNVSNSGSAIESNSLSVTYSSIDGITLTDAASFSSSMTTGKDYSMNFTLDKAKIGVGTYSIPLTLNYMFKGENKTKVVTIYLSVLDNSSTSLLGNRILIKNICTPLSVATGETADISFDVINEGSDVSSVTIYIKDSSSKVIASKYISTLASGDTKSFTFSTIAPSYTQTMRACVDYTYNSTSYSKSENFTFNIKSGDTNLEPIKSNLSVKNIVCPANVVIGDTNTLSFNIINNNASSFVSAEVTLMEGNVHYGYAFIGDIAANSSTPATLTFKCLNNKTYSFIASITYKDANNKSYTLPFSLNVTASSQTLGAETGSVKIQHVSSLIYSTKDVANTVTVNITNPTSTDVTGAEAYLYDENGNLIDSVFVSTLTANTQTPAEMSYTPTTDGKHTYKVIIYYLDSAKKKQTLSSTFTTTVKAEGAATEDGKPSNMKIATISNPSRIYTNVKTAVPYVIVNGGKGAAYNVEVYVTDSNGNELSRDYIGTVDASAKFEGETKIKFDASGEYELVLNVYYENFDDSKGAVTKSFTQSVADYRVTVGELSGYEWLVENEQATLTFSVQNLGALDLLNATANLVDQNGNTLGSCFIGVVSANSKSENLKFKKLFFTQDTTELSIQLSYENEGGEIFSAMSETPFYVTVMSYDDVYGGGGMDVPDYGMDEDGNQILGFDDAGNAIIGYDDMGNPILSGQSASEGGFPVWAWILIGVGAAVVVAVVVIVIVKKKKKKSDDNDDMEYFYAQNNAEKKDDNVENQ